MITARYLNPNLNLWTD